LKQADRDLSVPAQLDACRLHAERQGWQVTAEYHDDGISGFEDERRPAFRKMLTDMVGQPRPFDVIVVWDLSRFSRSLQHSLGYETALLSAGVVLESVKEHTDGSPSGWLAQQVFRSFNEYQVRKLADDTRRGMRKNAAEGGWNGGAVPFGYRVERADQGRGPGRLVPDPAQAPLVQRIYAMALSGQGACGICGTLNNEGLRTARGRRWSKQSVLYILRNDVYTGRYTWGVKASAKFATEPAEPLCIDDAHEALVSLEDFARVAAVIAVRRPTVTHPRTTAGSYLLSGLLICDACGAPYIGHGAKNGQHQYYTCQTKQKQGAKACPAANNFEQGRVEGVVLDALRDGALHPGVFADLVREVQASLRTGQADAEGERLVLEGQLSEVTRRLDNLYEAVESGSIPVARLAPRIEQVSQEKEALDARIAALPEAGTEPLLDIGDDDIEGWVADLRAVVERGSVDERRGLLQAWVKRVVARGDELTVEYTFPLVNVPGPGGSEPSGAPSKLRVVNRGGRRKPTMLRPETTKGEPAFRRVLPTVVNGSPYWT
jgi:site-specific DNA recombinase